jgi:hypothetical protein
MLPTSFIAPDNVFATQFCGRVVPQLGAVSRSDTAAFGGSAKMTQTF